MTEPLVQRVRRAYNADRAHSHVVAISGFHRIQASPGYRAAAAYVAEQLGAAGVETAIRTYPADGAARFWTTPSFLEWDCRAATLYLLDDAKQPVELLCDFAAIPTSLIQRSVAAHGDFEVVVDEADADVAGKLVLTDRPPAQTQQTTVRAQGAAGILFDGMKMGGRSPFDLPDARQYTSFWWAGATAPDGWGFVLSPRQGQRLRELLAKGKPVRVRAHIEARFYPGEYEVVEASIPGAEPAAGEVLLVSHLCHPKPGAHDNASGAAALLECAATLAQMLREGTLPPLRRGIRFLWPPEMTGTYAWLAAHEEALASGRWVAGLNLDMVGADQCQTGGAWELVALPQASASYSDHLLSWLREPLLAGQRHTETPFSGGSDHYILSDPTVGIPAPMLIQWPDRFYHTSADTPDRVSPDSLARSGTLAAAYAAWLAAAGPAETRWLGGWMVSRYATQAARDALAAIEGLREADAPGRARIWYEYRRMATFRAERMRAALATLTRLDPDCGERVRSLTAQASYAEANQRMAVESELVTYLAEDEPLPAPPDAPDPGEAGVLIPRRLARGPVDAGMALQAIAPERVSELWRLSDEAGAGFYDVSALLQYWADGERTVAEIAGLAALEAGAEVSPEIALRYFRLLEATGYLALEEAAHG